MNSNINKIIAVCLVVLVIFVAVGLWHTVFRGEVAHAPTVEEEVVAPEELPILTEEKYEEIALEFLKDASDQIVQTTEAMNKQRLDEIPVYGRLMRQTAYIATHRLNEYNYAAHPKGEALMNSVKEYSKVAELMIDEVYGAEAAHQVMVYMESLNALR